MTSSNPARYTQGGALECISCGASYMPAYPLPVGALIVLARWWDDTHRHCLAVKQVPLDSG